MTDEMMTLCTLLEKSSDADLLREMIGFTAQRLMGWSRGQDRRHLWREESAERFVQRNGYRRLALTQLSIRALGTIHNSIHLSIRFPVPSGAAMSRGWGAKIRLRGETLPSQICTYFFKVC
jgi:hypothetical protein